MDAVFLNGQRQGTSFSWYMQRVQCIIGIQFINQLNKMANKTLVQCSKARPHHVELIDVSYKVSDGLSVTTVQRKAGICNA